MMRRLGLLLLLCGLVLPAVAQAQGCRGVELERIVESVPYLGKGMRREDATATSASFVHVDDARLRLSVSLVPGTPASSELRRSGYLAARLAEIDAEAARLPAGTETRTSVGYRDPVSWTLQARTPSGDDTVSRGVITAKLRPACDLAVRWEVLETPNLIGRIRDLNAAIDALRSGPGGYLVPSAFAPENQTPTGWPSLFLGVVVPFLAAAGFGYVFRSMARAHPPHRRVRIASAAGALAAGIGLALQLPVYAENLSELRYVDNAVLVSASALGLALVAALGRPSVTLGALSLALAAGLVLGVQAYLGWAPMLEVTVALSLVLTALGGFGTWAWGAFPERRRAASARKARARARDKAAGGRVRAA